MKFSIITPVLVLAGAISASPVELEKRANLPGLGATQSSHARAIIKEAKAESLPRQACLAGITTGLTESSLYVYANSGVPKSLDYPHDKVGSDHDSVGIFQQRVTYYPNIAADMDPAKSAKQFFTEMKKISGWKTKDVATLCQDVQKSAVPDAYKKYTSLAAKICSADGY